MSATPTTLDVPPPRLVDTRDDRDLPRAGAPSPTRVGRFALVEQVGRGGMGVVYAAWDPQLDRKVAIKLVDDARDADPDDARHRLEQEARAAATLNHPNIVTIYDVGVHDGRVFLAMEYVAGCTLGAWLRRRVRPWTEVVAMFLQVGRGLAAAHAVGLVHRDFKPDNVLLELADGDPDRVVRPRIADFGLAYSRSPRGSASTLPGDGDRPSQCATPSVAGTPAYMAPEQFDGLDVGPAADQFGFCVALFEGLFGARPFSGSKFEVLSIAVHAGEIVVPDARRVPRRLLAALRRGLDPDPERRHRSIDALLGELHAALHARRRRWRVAVAATAGVLALGLGFRAARAVTPEPCAQADDAAALWSPASRAAVGERIADAATIESLERYAADFGDKRREACEATRVRGEQSDSVLALRMACLDRVAARFAGLTEELDDTADLDAASIATRLPELAACDDVETLARLTNRMAARSSRESAAQDRAWTLAVGLLERSLTRRLLGRADAREPAMQARALADEHGLPGVHARALSILADLELEAGDGTSAQRLRREAMRHGVADGHDDAVVSMLLDDADAALQDARAGEAELLLGYFEAFVDRMTDADARGAIEQRAEIVRARLALARGDAAEAERRLEGLAFDALPALDRRAAWMALGDAQRARGEAEAATATWTRLLALVEDLRGDRHPDVAAVLNNLALVRLDDGDADGADALLARAESIVTEASGTAALQATIATNRGWAARLGHRYDESRRRLEHARALREVAFGSRHPSMAYTLDQLGELERALGRWDAALEAFAAAGELRDATLGAMHPELVPTLVGTARVLIARGENDRARAALGVAGEILDAHPGGTREREMIAALEAATR